MYQNFENEILGDERKKNIWIILKSITVYNSINTFVAKDGFSPSRERTVKCAPFNPLTLRPGKTGLTNLEIYYLQKHFLENI